MTTIQFSACRLRAAAASVLAVTLLGLAAPLLAQAPAGATAPAGHNVYAAGGRVRPGSAVQGDYVAVGGRVVVDQAVQRDALLAGGSVDLRAPVGQNVRVAGGDINIDSAIGGELFATGGNVTLNSGAHVAQSARLYGGNLAIDGKIDGALDAGAQKIVIDGEVGGDARLDAGEIELGPHARIAGALSYASGSDLKKADGATIGGAVTRQERAAAPRHDGARQRTRTWSGPFWLGRVFTFLALLACAAVFLLVAPRFAASSCDTLERAPWLALALGFGTLVALPVLAVLLFISLLGIPLGLVVMALYPALLLVGYVVGVLAIARLAKAALRKEAPESFAMSIGFFALALLLVMLVGRLPFVGGLAVGVVTVLGIGACVLEVYRRRQGGVVSPGAPLAASAPPGAREPHPAG